MKMMTGAFLLLFAMANILHANEKATYPWRDEYPLKQSAGVSGRAVLSVPKLQLKTGERFECDIRFEKEGADGYVFNPFLNGLVPLPLVLVLYDADHKYMGSYLSHENRQGSQRSVTQSDWVYLTGASGYVGTKVRLRAGRLPGMSSMDSPLPQGKYYLQAVYFRSFIGLTQLPDKIFRPDSDGEEFGDNFDRSELFRSNAIEIELIE